MMTMKVLFEKETYCLELLSIGLVNDMYTESRNDEWGYREVATQEDFGRF